jgi:hypothetical protein
VAVVASWCGSCPCKFGVGLDVIVLYNHLFLFLPALYNVQPSCQFFEAIAGKEE